MNALSNLGVNFGIDYAKYQAIKGEKGDFVDFLIGYDSKASEDGDDSWMSSLFGGDDILGSIPPELYGKMDAKTIENLTKSNLGSDEDTFGIFDTQASALKIQLVEAFKKRIENDTALSAEAKASKVADLYKQAESVALPSRFTS